MKFLLSFSCLAALSFVGANSWPSRPPPIRAEYHYLTDSAGVTWYDADYDRLIRWVNWRDRTVPIQSGSTFLQYRPIPSYPSAPPAVSKPPRSRRRYGPGPDDWEYDSLQKNRLFRRSSTG